MGQKIVTRSRISSTQMVEIDPYGANPLLEDARGATAQLGVRILGKGAGPRMFTGGASDLPAFTASGVDPAALMTLPFTTRHYAAALPSTAAFYRFMEENADFPDAEVGQSGLSEAIQRMYGWVQGTWSSQLTTLPTRESLTQPSGPVAPAATGRTRTSAKVSQDQRVQAAVDEGRIPPARAAFWENLLATDPSAARSLRSLAAVSPDLLRAAPRSDPDQDDYTVLFGDQG